MVQKVGAAKKFLGGGAAAHPSPLLHEPMTAALLQIFGSLRCWRQEDRNLYSQDFKALLDFCRHSRRALSMWSQEFEFCTPKCIKTVFLSSPKCEFETPTTKQNIEPHKFMSIQKTMKKKKTSENA